MSRIITIAVAALAVAAPAAPLSANAATMAAKPAAKPAAPVADLYCQLSKNGTNVSIQAVNKGMTTIKAGTTFDFMVLGGKHKTAESYKLQWDIGPHEAINVTKPMPAANVTGCSPAAA